MTRSKRIYPHPPSHSCDAYMCICACVCVCVCVCVSVSSRRKKRRWTIYRRLDDGGVASRKNPIYKSYTRRSGRPKNVSLVAVILLFFFFFLFPFFFLIEASRDRFPIVDERRIVYVRTQLPSKRRKNRTRKRGNASVHRWRYMFRFDETRDSCICFMVLASFGDKSNN